MSHLLNVIESILSAADADRTKGVHLDREVLDNLEEAVLSEDGVNGLRLAWKAFKRSKQAEAELLDAMALLTEIYESGEVGSYSDMGKKLAAMVDDLAPEVDE